MLCLIFSILDALRLSPQASLAGNKMTSFAVCLYVAAVKVASYCRRRIPRVLSCPGTKNATSSPTPMRPHQLCYVATYIAAPSSTHPQRHQRSHDVTDAAMASLNLQPRHQHCYSLTPPLRCQLRLTSLTNAPMAPPHRYGSINTAKGLGRNSSHHGCS